MRPISSSLLRQNREMGSDAQWFDGAGGEGQKGVLPLVFALHACGVGRGLHPGLSDLTGGG